MSPKISLITATVGAALVVGVPSAWGTNHVGDPRDEAARNSPVIVELLTSKNGAVDSSLIKALSRPVPIREAPIIIEGAPSGPVATSSNTGSGIELDWSQLGIGFGVGFVLALGLVLGLRYARVRPLAH